MWFLGHFGLGFLSAFLVSSITGQEFQIPLILFVSMLPDLDAFTFGLIKHRGATHSLITAAMIYLPLSTILGLPYLAALLSHAIGDYLYPPFKMLWPLSNRWYGAPDWLRLSGRTETTVEVTLFILMIIVILHTQYPII
jgi:membrane-bound metal-dependent hydrolase YbcI (DUF457 family)